MLSVLARVCIVAACCCGLWQVSSQPTSQPAKPKQAQWEIDYLQRPQSFENWNLRLDSVHLTPDGISEISATLHNRSNKTVMIDTVKVSRYLFRDARIWTAKKEGSYSMALYDGGGGGRRPSRFRVDCVPLRPGESIQLSRRFGTSDFVRETKNGGFSGCIAIWYHPQYYRQDKEKSSKEKLTSGEYVIDAVLELSFATVTPEGKRGASDTVRICTDNKLWVSIDE